jgi:hypothetical protein
MTRFFGSTAESLSSPVDILATIVSSSSIAACSSFAVRTTLNFYFIIYLLPGIIQTITKSKGRNTGVTKPECRIF